MDDLREQIKDYNQAVLDLSFGCSCEACPRCKKKHRRLPDTMCPRDNSAFGKAI
jgi:hypothetical protein